MDANGQERESDEHGKEIDGLEKSGERSDGRDARFRARRAGCGRARGEREGWREHEKSTYERS